MSVDFVPNFDETEKEPAVLAGEGAEPSGKRCGRYRRWYGNQHSDHIILAKLLMRVKAYMKNQ